mgnify:CR=1 FL=1
MRKAKSIDELYEEVKHHDLVLTVDVALADALNRRLNRPVLGSFATTPRKLAFSGGQDFEKEVFLKLVDDLDLTWKQASFILGKALDCWRETGEVENILRYEQYSEETTQEVVDKLKQYDTPFKAMEEYSPKGDVAVINPYQFTELDKKVLPDDYDTYSIFSDEETSLNEFNSFGSGLELVKSVVENIETVGPENAGIAVHPQSKYQSLLESYFKSSEIDYITQDEIDSEESFRNLVKLMRVGLSNRVIRLKDVRALIDSLDLDVSVRNPEARLDSVEGLEEFKEFLNVIEFLEVKEVIERMEDLSGQRFEGVRQLLEQLGFLDESVSSEVANRILNFVDNFDVVSEQQSSGVLLADPRKTSVIDRPVVFLLGMSSDWSEKPESEPWKNTEEIEEDNCKNFESLIQSGDKTVYMIEESLLDGEERPCHYFAELFDGFSLEKQEVVPKTCSENQLSGGFDKAEVDVDEKEFVLSQSSLNDLLISPRVFYMSRLVSDVEEESMKKGSLFHDFAELYFNKPDTTEEKLDEITELFVKEMRPISDPVSIKRLETELRIGLKRIMSFLDGKEPYQENSYEKDGKYPNFFEQELGLDVDTNSTEMSFNHSSMKITGKVDLITSDNHLIDYKSGRKYSEKQIVQKSRVETASDQRYPDMQALMYITQHAEKHDGEIKFSFVYFLEDLGEEVNGGKADNLARTVKYFPEKFHEKASEIEVFEMLFSDVKKSNNRRKTLEKLGYTLYSEFLNKNGFPEVYSKEEILKTDYTDKFISLCVEEVGDYKYARKGAKSAVKKLIEFRNKNFFKEDVEKFKDFIEEKHSELKEFEENGYPVGDREISELPDNDLVIE